MTESQDGALSRGHALASVLDRTRAMALSRKLGKEIEQALKKVSDGITTFTELGGKMAAAEVTLPSLPAHFLPCSRREDTCEDQII